MGMNLEGIRVVELTHWVAGPLAGQILGEWGADVVHVERTGAGDVTRLNGPFYKGESLYYRTYNRDKRAVTLDIGRPEGLETILQLIEQADVFLTNYQVSFLEKCGLTYERIQQRNPRIVACYISGFGLTGRYKNKKALDMVIQAMSGQMATNGEPNGHPMKTGTITGDYNGAYQAALGTVIALFGRERTGKGQLLDISITDALISGLEWRIPEYRLTGKTTLRTGNRRPTIAPCNLYTTKDGYVYIAAASQKMYEKLVGVIGDERLMGPDFAKNAQRVANVEAMDAIINEWLQTKSNAEAVALLEKAGVPSGPLFTPAELATGDYVDEKGLVIEIDDPVVGPIPFMSSPIKMESGYRTEHLAPPTLGQDNEAVYKEYLGWDSEKLDAMKRAGVI